MCGGEGGGVEDVQGETEALRFHPGFPGKTSEVRGQGNAPSMSP